MNQSNEITNLIKSKAKELGFLECAIVPAGFLSEEQPHFEKWLSDGFHGEMGYMARNTDKRLDPRLLVENAKTIIIVLQNYFTSKSQIDNNAPIISKYAYGEDYHKVMKEKLSFLFSAIREQMPSVGGRIFVDSAPVLERAWARRAGLGWVGKNSNLISPEHGSFFFIGEMILDAELPCDQPEPVRDRCGNCTRCLDACPTQAIIADRVVDARKCISYQTIELKGELDEQLTGQFKNRVFGCDICQDVCPWNLKSVPHNEPAFQASNELMNLRRRQWFLLEEADFSRLFRKSAVQRTGFNGLKRNLDFIENDSHE
jgi:epoxyqueuosine reductase